MNRQDSPDNTPRSNHPCEDHTLCNHPCEDHTLCNHPCEDHTLCNHPWQGYTSPVLPHPSTPPSSTPTITCPPTPTISRHTRPRHTTSDCITLNQTASHHPHPRPPRNTPSNHDLSHIPQQQRTQIPIPEHIAIHHHRTHHNQEQHQHQYTVPTHPTATTTPPQNRRFRDTGMKNSTHNIYLCEITHKPHLLQSD